MRFTVLGREFRCTTDAGVFSGQGLDRGSRLLIERVRVAPGDRILDLGAGWGPIAVALGARFGCEVVCIERNARAADLCRRNLARHGVRGEVLVGDGLAAAGGARFDRILLNPPIRAGKATYYPWLAAAREHLAPAGELWVVVRSRQGAKSLRRELQRLYAEVRDEAIDGGYRVYCAR